MIRGITFDNQMFYSADFAHFLNFFLDGSVGTTKGCSITHDGTKVTIGKGYFIAQGRLMNVEVEEVVEQGFASGYNRIVYEIDLSKENTISEFKQGVIKVLNTEELVQEDLDAGGTIYQLPICHFQWSGTAISNFGVDVKKLEEPSFDQPAIEIDGAICSGKLKLSTKYQWVLAELIDLGDISYNTIKKFVYYKNEIHIFTKASSNNHFKLVNGQLLPDVDVPFTPSDYVYNWVCVDDNYIYGIGNVTISYNVYKINVYRFDGETWEEIFVLPKELDKDYLQRLGIPSVLSGKLYLSFVTSSDKKCAGYLDLATLTWVNLPTLPNSIYGYNAFTEIDGVIYLLSGSNNSNSLVKLNTDNSLTYLSYPAPTIKNGYFDILTINNKAYIIQPYAFYCFDGSKVKLLSTLDAFLYPSLLFINKFCIFGSIQQAVTTAENTTIYDVLKTYEKVLCLED